MTITATNKATGEVIELEANTPAQIVQAWRIAQEYDKAATALKNQLKELVPKIVDDKGLSETHENYMFRVSNIQRMTYNKSVMREVFDADTYDLFLKPDKPAVDKYLKENLGDISTTLRQSMLPEGRPYQVIKLEKIARD